MMSPPGFEDLPGTLPIFPLSGVVLLPRGRLPLNIFEPRYLAMVEDAIKGNRLIGMVQPSGPCIQGKPPALFRTGCGGRIVAFNENDDGRYVIALAGISRFNVAQEVEMARGYRRIMPDWSPFADDLIEEDFPPLDRERLTSLLQPYFQRQGLSADWDAIAATPDEKLVISLAMICPFGPPEKQALLEAPNLADRAEVMFKLLEMSVDSPGECGHAH